MKKVLKYGILIGLVLVIILLTINFYVVKSVKGQIIKEGDYSSLNNIDCIIVLGAGVWGDRPSPMLEDRLNQGINLYKLGISNKILMTGDHGKKDYDEVNIMKSYAIQNGVLSSDVFMDHAGFSTYESIYRAKYVFQAKRVVIVTQEYHLYRALYIANKLGLEAYGVNSNPRKYAGQIYRDLREVLARDKDFVKTIFKPKPTYLGDTISIHGNGDITNDK